MTFGETITITRPTVGVGDDEHGNPNPGTPVTISSDGWAVAPSTEDEDQETFGAYPVTGVRLLNKSQVDVRTDDTVTVRGLLYKVVGSAASWVSPNGSDLGGTVVSLERVA